MLSFRSHTCSEECYQASRSNNMHLGGQIKKIQLLNIPSYKKKEKKKNRNKCNLEPNLGNMGSLLPAQIILLSKNQ